MEQSFDFNNFMAKYVTTNVATDAKAFDQPFLLDMLKELNSINANFSNGRLNFQLLVSLHFTDGDSLWKGYIYRVKKELILNV